MPEFTRSNRTMPAWIGMAVYAAAAGVLALSAVFSVLRNLDFAWTSIRLAPAFALAHGEPLFSLPDTPPWVMVGYGPLYPVAYLPATLFATPASAVAVATMLAHLYLLVPAGMLFASLCARIRHETPDAPHWTAALLLWALIACAAPSLRYVMTNVHVDAPALGLFLCAAYALLRADTDAEPFRWICIAAIAAGLSVTCKINLAAAALAFSVWTFWRAGRRAALTFVASTAATILLVYGCTAARDGVGAVLFNLQLPGKMPWLRSAELGTLALSGTTHDLGDKLQTFLTLLSDYIVQYGVVTIALLLLLPMIEERKAPASRVITFFLVIAAFMLPASIASVGKSGGDVNSRALVTLPLTIAAVAGVIALSGSTWVSLLARHAAVVGLTFVVGLNAFAGLLRATIMPGSTLAEAHQVISAEPGRWYFPFDPLAHLLGEGRFRPNMDVVHSYAAAGAPVEQSAFRAALPEGLEAIALPPAFATWGGAELQRLLPEYKKIPREQDLEHHRVITK